MLTHDGASHCHLEEPSLMGLRQQIVSWIFQFPSRIELPAYFIILRRHERNKTNQKRNFFLITVHSSFPQQQTLFIFFHFGFYLFVLVPWGQTVSRGFITLRTTIQKEIWGTFTAVQWLRHQASRAGGGSSIPGWGTQILPVSFVFGCEVPLLAGSSVLLSTVVQ